MTKKLSAFILLIICLACIAGCSRLSETAVPVKHNIFAGDTTELQIDLPIQMNAKAQNLTPADTQGYIIKQLGYIDRSKNAADFSAITFSSVHLNTDKIASLSVAGKKTFMDNMEKSAVKSFTASYLQSVNGSNSAVEKKEITINGIDAHEYIVTYRSKEGKPCIANMLYIPDDTEVWIVVIDYPKDSEKAEKQAGICLSSIKIVKK
ncbi:MAG: hypothetical protein SOV43_06110 [Selenomonadaceae bacterium]|nr:hypothetical protein [Selenomonadaceae bacterium]